MGRFVVSPHEPADGLRDDVEDVHRKRPIGVADPGDVGHRQALDDAEDEGNLAALHPVDQAKRSGHARKHADPTVGRDEIDSNLKQDENADVDNLEGFPFGKELIEPPVMLDVTCHVDRLPVFK